MNLSVLDVAAIGSGSSASAALRNSLELAQLAERLGYTRFWFAEHHGMPSIASSSPEVLIARTASVTTRIRVGSGGIMLPNHAPMRIAEAFLTLEALFPGRIDLGIGRAPGADPRASAAMRPIDAHFFPSQLDELIGIASGTLPPDHPFAGVRAVPNDVPLPPIWLLGSSGASARFAGQHGFGYSFARHFSPAPPAPAMLEYRASFQPSPQFPEPHAILAVSVVCADTDEEADRLAASLDLMWIRIRRGEFLPVPTPEEALAYPSTPMERHFIEENRARYFIGTPERVRREILDLVAATQADEVMVTSMVHSHAARLRSYELLAEVFGMVNVGL